MTKPFNCIGIAGSGTMGAGIAQVCALAGYSTVLFDISPDMLVTAMDKMEASVQKGIDRGKLPKNALEELENTLTTTHHLEELAKADLIIEAIPEQIRLKQELFSKLDTLCSPNTHFASNTSSLSITSIAAATQRPSHVAGMHFFNPVPQMKLVEVIQGKETTPALMNQLRELAISLGKTPVTAKDTPGFIVNRVARAFYGEAFRLMEEGVADTATLDAIMREEGGFPMGPFELMDLIGIDINYAVTQSVYEAFFEEARFKPHPLQRQMVEAGHLGRKTGKGFYSYV